MSDLRCTAMGCGAARRKGQIFCAPHWRMVPAARQDAILEAGRRKDREAAITEVRGAIRDLADWEGRS